MPPRGGALAQYSDKRFGRRTALREGDVTVTSTGVEVLPNNPDRLHLLLTNNGAIYGTCRTRRGIVIDRGERADPSGGGLEYDPDIDGEGVGYAIYCISSGADIVVSYSETVAVGPYQPEQNA